MSDQPTPGWTPPPADQAGHRYVPDSPGGTATDGNPAGLASGPVAPVSQSFPPAPASAPVHPFTPGLMPTPGYAPGPAQGTFPTQPPVAAPAPADAWAPGVEGLSAAPASGTLPAAQQTLDDVRREVAKAVVGQDAAVSGLLIGLLCGGHVLLEGVPGVAKTLLVRSLAAALDLQTKRVQFTPDLMPGDVTGSLIYDAAAATFDFRPGPVFTNLLLADEINRTPPKTQASLLEAMEEHQVSADGVTHPLPDPFMVIATQNPVEYEGTYPLPEAQLDRFLLKLELPLPSRDDEVQVIARHARGFDPRELGAAGLRAVAGADELASARAHVSGVRIDPPVVGYVVDVCRATRSAPSVSLGVSPRGATALMRTSRAWAWMNGRDFVTPDDVKALAIPTLNHRIQVRTEAQMDGTTTASIIANVLATVPVPR